ncbi:MAG: hypothetical protein LLF75_08230 [Eubacteriales bacterium]|nr:hypothetical protein [Eubacteriales bacterium]
MEQKQSYTSAYLPSGWKLTITLNRSEAERAPLQNEIVVYDDRFTGNPSFRIFGFYRVRKNRVKREVIAALFAYNSAFPSDPAWRRTERSLVLEWMEHNFAYRLGFLKSRARDVDLDNHAEGKGSFGYFLQSAWGVIRGYIKPKARRTSEKSHPKG